MRWRRGRQPGPDAPRVIVVGAGFAGLSAVEQLAGAGAQVMLIDQHVYSTFQPLLYQVATAGLNPGDVAYPVRAFTRKHGARFRLGELAGIDTRARTITLLDGGRYEYDYLVLATGVTASYYGIKGAADYSLGLYTRRDAITLRDHIMARLERLDIGPAKDLNFTVVGGGATGVELAGTLAELREHALAAAFPGVDEMHVHIRLVEQFPALLGPFHEDLRKYAYQQLRDRGVDVRLNTKIREITPTAVLLENGEDLPSDVTAWAAGVAAPATVANWGLPQGKNGRIRVGPDLRVVGQDRIFAGGDIAVSDENPLPQLAQPAIQAGRHIGAQILALAAGQPTERFVYHDKGIMATIGRRSAVVQLPRGLRFRGTIAWLAWLGLHLITLLGGRNRLSALLNLSWRYLAWGRGGGVIVGDDPPAVSPGGPPQAVPTGARAMRFLPRAVPGSTAAPDGAARAVPGNQASRRAG
jgi:NADH:ubiquinone reductase (H+-translocating)